MPKPSEFFEKHVFQLLVGMVFLILLIGTVVFHFIENWSYLNAYYFSVVTLTTVGYGDLTPTTPFGRFFTTLYIFVGVGIIATFAQAIVKRGGKRMAHKAEIRHERRETRHKR